MQEHDQILAINGQILDSTISSQQAISILQMAVGRIQLVVAHEAVTQTWAVTNNKLGRNHSSRSNNSDAGVSLILG